MSGYRATAVRVDEAWIVRIVGLPAPAALTARDLADVEPRVRSHIAATTHEKAKEIDIEVSVHLDPSAQVHLNAARHYFTLAMTECDAATNAMADQGVPLLDIARVIALYRPALLPFVVTNAEIAQLGLQQYPNAIGIEWDDHGAFRTRKCRDCVDNAREEYRDIDPQGENALVYRVDGFACDGCDLRLGDMG
jgi:hypothetical protein